MKAKAVFLLAALAPSAAWAADFVDTARVVSSVAVYERVNTPKQECWTEMVSSTGAVTRSVPEERSIGGAIVGGVVGGVVGNQVGKGSGNTVATAAGAIAGAIIGDRIANRDQGARTETIETPQVREERRCRQIDNYREVITGYDVTYRYNGRDAVVRLSEKPGATVRVSVSVNVVNDQAGSGMRGTAYEDERDRPRRHPHDRGRRANDGGIS